MLNKICTLQISEYKETTVVALQQDCWRMLFKVDFIAVRGLDHNRKVIPHVGSSENTWSVSIVEKMPNYHIAGTHNQLFDKTKLILRTDDHGYRLTLAYGVNRLTASCAYDKTIFSLFTPIYFCPRLFLTDINVIVYTVAYTTFGEWTIP